MAENPLDPSPQTEQKIRERAYHLWEAEGRPEGRDGEYWERARELQGIADSAGAAQMPNPATAHPTPVDTVEEASIQENLGEFPHAGLSDQGDRAETPSLKARAAAKAQPAPVMSPPATPAPAAPKAKRGAKTAS